MKKLLIVAAVAMAAIASNAAAVTWSTGGLAYGGSTLAKETATGYLWIISSTEYGSYSSYTDGEALSKATMATTRANSLMRMLPPLPARKALCL